jgi:hypothetical protein
LAEFRQIEQASDDGWFDVKNVQLMKSAATGPVVWERGHP